jgi:hypothetical protein
MPLLSLSGLLPAPHRGHALLAWALQSAMPKLLTNGQKTPKEQMIRFLDSTTVKNWNKNMKWLPIVATFRTFCLAPIPETKEIFSNPDKFAMAV